MSDEAEADPRMPKPPPPAKVPEEAASLQDAKKRSSSIPPEGGTSDRPGPRSLVPLPEGYDATRRSSGPPGRLSPPAPRRSDPPRPRLSSTPPKEGVARGPSKPPPNRSDDGAKKTPESKAVVTPMRIIPLKSGPPTAGNPAVEARLPGSDAPTPPDTPAAVASSKPAPAAGVDAPTPPETPALRRELMQQASAELATTQESQGAAPPPQAEAQPAVAVQQPRLEPPPVPPRVPEQASPTDADDDDSIEVEITSADSSDNLEAISAEELTEVEAVSEREPEASQPPMPPKPPPTPAAGQAAPPPPSPAATPSPSEQDKLAPPPPRSTKGAQATRPRRKRLPRTPPRRRSFTGGSEGGKRRPWWEELWNDDFLRADPVPEEHRLFQEVDFIEQSLSVQPGAVVLDLACGAGDHAVELSRRGLSVVGYDISETQLIRAKDLAEYEEQDVRFMQGDIREMAFEKMFDAVYCWNASFGYFEEEKNLAVLANIFRSLKPGGSFLLDVPNRDFVVRQQPMQTWFEGDNAVCMDDMYVDFITSRLNVKRTVMLDDGRNREWYYSLRLYSLHELGKMLHSIGFKVGQISGDVATPNAFLGSYSQRVIILAVKPNEAPSKKS